MFELRRKVNGRPLLVGHRGARAVAPENTLLAFEAGLAGGADILELDVQLTADGQVIVFHDYDLAAKTGVPGRVGDYPAAYLQTLDVGYTPGKQFADARMPLLREVLAWARGRIPLMIEHKHGPIFTPALDSAVVALVEEFGMVDDVVCTSFDQFALQRIRQLNPDIATSFIYVGRLLDPLAVVRVLQVDALSPATNFLTREEVVCIQEAGYACSPGGTWWDYATLLEWGVDTISSDDPASVRLP